MYDRPSSASSPPLQSVEAVSARSQSAGSAPEAKSPIMAQLHGEAVKRVLDHSRAISPSGALPNTPPAHHRKPLGITPLPLPLSPAHRHVSSPSSTSSSSSFQRLSRYCACQSPASAFVSQCQFGRHCSSLFYRLFARIVERRRKNSGRIQPAYCQVHLRMSYWRATRICSRQDERAFALVSAGNFAHQLSKAWLDKRK